MDSSLAKTIFKYTRSSLYTRLIMLIYAYIKPRFLTPEMMGLWSFLNTIISLSAYSDLGARSSIKYKIPPLERENKIDEIQEIKGAVYYGTYYFSLIIVIALLFASYFGNYQIEMRIGLIAIAVLIILRWQYEYLLAVLKATQNFNIIIKSNYIMPTVRLIMGGILIYYFSFYGLLTTTLVSLGIIVVYIKFKFKNDIKNPFKFSVYKDLVKSGFGIMLFASSLTTLVMANRVVITYYLGLEQLGFYSIALVIADIIMKIPMTSRDVIEPRVAQLIDAQAIEKTLNDYYFTPLYNIAYYCPFLVFGVCFMLPPAIELLLPRYTEGVLAAQVLVFGTVFLGLSYATRSLIVINNKQLKSVIYILFALAINVYVSIFFIQNFNYGIAGVALATVISHAVLFLLLYVVISSIYKKQRYIYHFFYLILPFLCSILIIFISHYYINHYIINNYIASITQLIFSSLVMYAIIFILNKNNKFVYFYKPKLKKFNKKTSIS